MSYARNKNGDEFQEALSKDSGLMSFFQTPMRELNSSQFKTINRLKKAQIVPNSHSQLKENQSIKSKIKKTKKTKTNQALPDCPNKSRSSKLSDEATFRQAKQLHLTKGHTRRQSKQGFSQSKQESWNKTPLGSNCPHCSTMQTIFKGYNLYNQKSLELKGQEEKYFLEQIKQLQLEEKRLSTLNITLKAENIDLKEQVAAINKTMNMMQISNVRLTSQVQSLRKVNKQLLANRQQQGNLKDKLLLLQNERRQFKQSEAKAMLQIKQLNTKILYLNQQLQTQTFKENCCQQLLPIEEKCGQLYKSIQQKRKAWEAYIYQTKRQKDQERQGYQQIIQGLQDKISALEQSLSQLEQNSVQKKQKMEKELRELTRQCREQKEKKAQLQAQIQACKRHNKNIQEMVKLKELQHLQEIKKQNQAFQDKEIRLNKMHAAALEESDSKSQQLKRELQVELNKRRTQAIEFQNVKKEFLEEKSKYKADIEVCKHKVKTLQLQMKAKVQKETMMAAQNKELEKALEEKNISVSREEKRIKEQLREKDKETIKLNSLIVSIRNQLAEAKKALSSSKNQVLKAQQNSSAQRTKLGKQHQELVIINNTLTSQVTQLQKQLAVSNERNLGIQREYEAIKQQTKKIKANIVISQRDLYESQVKVQQYEIIIEKLKDKKSELQEEIKETKQENNRVISDIMNEKRQLQVQAQINCSEGRNLMMRLDEFQKRLASCKQRIQLNEQFVKEQNIKEQEYKIKIIQLNETNKEAQIQIKELNRTIQQLEIEQLLYKQQLKNSQQLINTYKIEAQSFSLKISQLQNQKIQQLNELYSLWENNKTQQTINFNTKLEKAIIDNTETQKMLESRQNQIQEKNNIIQLREAKIKDIEDVLAECHELLCHQKKEREKLCEERQILGSEKDQLEEQIRNLQQNMYKMEQRLKEYKSKIQVYQDREAKINAQLSKFTGQINQTKTTNSLRSMDLVNSIRHVVMSNERMRMEMEVLKNNLKVTKDENSAIEKLMGEQIQQRKVIIEQLMHEKRLLYSQINCQ